jgi:hypothetical protein
MKAMQISLRFDCCPRSDEGKFARQANCKPSIGPKLSSRRPKFMPPNAVCDADHCCQKTLHPLRSAAQAALSGHWPGLGAPLTLPHLGDQPILHRAASARMTSAPPVVLSWRRSQGDAVPARSPQSHRQSQYKRSPRSLPPLLRYSARSSVG